MSTIEEKLDYRQRRVTHEIIQEKREDVLKHFTNPKYAEERQEILDIFDRIDELIDDRIIYLDKWEDSKSMEDYEKIAKIKEEMQTLFDREFEIYKKVYEDYENLIASKSSVVFLLVIFLFLLLFLFLFFK